MNNPRVAMLVARFYPVLGGTEKQALLLAKQLQQEGTGVCIITARLKDQKAFELVKNVQTYRTFSYFPGSVGSLFFMFSALLLLFKKRNEYDIIHVHLASSPALTAVIAGCLLHKPVIVKLGGGKVIGDIDSSSRTWFGRLKLYILKKGVDRFIATTREIEKQLEASGLEQVKIVTIPNGVNINEYAPADAAGKTRWREENKSAGQIFLVYAGRLEPEKNLSAFITAFSQAVKSCQALHFLIIGSGSEEALLKQLTARLALEQKVTFLGHVKEPALILPLADVFVLPSVSEGMPNALLEAMSCGLAVLASAVGGIKDLIQPGYTGLLFAPQDVSQMREVIIRIAGDQALVGRLGKNARLMIEQNHALAKITNQYQQLYRELMNG